MTVDEATRHRLFNELEEALSPESASALMTLLPPVGWADVATKHDVAVEVARLENSFRAELHREIGTLRTEMHTGLQRVLFSMLASQFTLAGLTWAAVSLA